MLVTTMPLRDITNTGAQMGRLARQYATDMAPYASWSLESVQRLVTNLPYRLDPEGREALHRPWISLHGDGIGRDCDDKAICMGAWAHLQGWHFRFVAAGNGDGIRRPAYHHVFCEILVPGTGWVRVDATYDYDRVGRHKTYKNLKTIFTTEPKR